MWSTFPATAPLSFVLTLPEIRRFIETFASYVHDAEVEHLWAQTPLRTFKVVGNAEWVEPPSIPREELILFEIHNHPAADRRRSEFLHLYDIAASFNGSNRVFGTYAVLVQPTGQSPYVVSCRFREGHLRDFMAGNASPYDQLRKTIAKVHGSRSRARQFASRVDSAPSLDALFRLFSATLPWLEFHISSRDMRLRPARGT